MKSLIKLNLYLAVAAGLFAQPSFAQSQGAGNGIPAPCSSKEKVIYKEISELLKAQPICLLSIADSLSNNISLDILKPKIESKESKLAFTSNKDGFYVYAFMLENGDASAYLAIHDENGAEVATATGDLNMNLRFLDPAVQKADTCLQDLPDPFPVASAIGLYGGAPKRHYTLNCWPQIR